uniref:Uncharacterized protein n=1 Tax=Arundo donax TaxID=35708 RepID=A0A0A8YVH5_ARUDO
MNSCFFFHYHKIKFDKLLLRVLKDQ